MCSQAGQRNFVCHPRQSSPNAFVLFRLPASLLKQPVLPSEAPPSSGSLQEFRWRFDSRFGSESCQGVDFPLAGFAQLLCALSLSSSFESLRFEDTLNPLVGEKALPVIFQTDGDRGQR